MFFLRVSFLACCFYMSAVVVLQAVVLIVGKGEEAIAFTERGNIAVFTIFFALIWLASFLLAFRIVFPKVWASFM